MIDGKILIEKLLVYAETFLDLNKRDKIYFRNVLLREFNLSSPYEGDEKFEEIKVLSVPDTLVNEVEEYALQIGKIKEDYERNLYSTYIFGLLSPLPAEVNRRFNEIKEKEGIIKASKYLYDLSIMNNYVQKTAINKNIKWDYVDGDKCLEITINLSKPEKSNKDIAKLLSLSKSDKKYPECFLCKENEGFMGSATHPARENIRTISLTMGGEPWFVQYSPYAYFNEHLIAISEKHTQMRIESDTIDKLLDFVDFFPNYIIGSNANLPIIGGSILNHEHYQGGGHIMPMHKASILKEYKAVRYKKVKVGIVDWYNSVIRLESKDRKQLGDLAKDIVKGWKNFTCESCSIYAETDGVKHNSLSPVMRKEGKTYICDIILRNNITTKEYPEGLFHAHPEYHNIKKEGIGLIEAMGLFILPGRLKTQLSMIADILCGNAEYNEVELNKEDNYLFAHRFMIKELFEKGKYDSKEQAEKTITDKINNICKNILYNTAVFKKDEVGQKGFENFLNCVSIIKK